MQTRDFVYIEDVVNATVLALKKSNLKSHVYNALEQKINEYESR